jgi:hypothetical protein
VEFLSSLGSGFLWVWIELGEWRGSRATGVMKRAAPSRHAAAAGCRPHGTAGCAWLVVILLLLTCCYCGERLRLSQPLA